MAKYYYKGNNKNWKRYFKIAGIGCVLGGFGMFIYFFFPVVAYQLFLGTPVQKQEIESPVPKYLIGRSNTVKNLIDQGISRIQFDYTDARNWYPQVQAETTTIQKETQPEIIENYFIEIPKLGIDNANVSTVNYNLSETLVHYYGPKNPLEKGTSVIFGHSTLPQWFNQDDYDAIFATLHTIEVGDELYVTVNGKKYTYQIFSTLITTPDDMNIFSQSYDNSYITLVTCTPPGTIWKRLIVRAALISE